MLWRGGGYSILSYKLFQMPRHIGSRHHYRVYDPFWSKHSSSPACIDPRPIFRSAECIIRAHGPFCSTNASIGKACVDVSPFMFSWESWHRIISLPRIHLVNVGQVEDQMSHSITSNAECKARVVIVSSFVSQVLMRLY